MPQKVSTADTIIEICNRFGVSIYLDGTDEQDAAKIGSPYLYEPNDKVLTIFLINLRPTTWEKLRPFLKEKWGDLGLAFDDTKEKELESIIEYKEENPDAAIIEFFTNKISDSDLTILKLSLYLRSEKAEGHDITEYKREIWERFGERGAYISNLVTGGYYEEFMEMAPHMSDYEFSKYYELMVGKELRAIFVHSRLKAADFRDKFEDTLINARRHSIKSFRIHGFGSWNVSLIKNFFDSYKDDEDGMWGEFDLITNEYSKYPPSLIYEVKLKEFVIEK